MQQSVCKDRAIDDWKAYELLQSIRQQLAGYRVTQCALAHECVVSVSRSDYGIRADHPGWQIRLQGFCNRNTRQERLGCAHTTANDRYKSLVRKLTNAGIADDLVAPLSEIDEIIMSIYLIDHEKGMLDKKCAVFSAERKVLQLQEAERKLNEVLAIHFHLIERLGTLHTHIMNRIDRLLVMRARRPAE